MQIRVGFELIYRFPQPTPMIMTVDVHYSRASDILFKEGLATDPSVPIAGYRDGFGNWCSRILAPAGQIRITNGAVVRDSGMPDVVVPAAWQQTLQSLPEETLVFLLGSRYCETDLLSQLAWDLFSQSAPGWQRVQAICDYVHNHIVFDYQQARATRTAWETFKERTGVCRDYTHLAITLCRCLNIPARYCTGYLGDMGRCRPMASAISPRGLRCISVAPGTHSIARNNIPRIGRVLIARGRDAADVAIATTFGPNTLESFKVWTDETSALLT